jgi:predicted lipoprotein
MPCKSFSMVRTAMAAVSFVLCPATVALADTPDFVQSVYRDWMVPAAAHFARDSARLTPALQALCDAPADRADASLRQARQRWRAALSSWERLSTVAIGPLIERRSQRQIDFTPTRPHLIEKAVRSMATGAADMELIGTPAKGLPALEWLLWVRPVQPASPECLYAVQVALEIEREAEALAEAYKQAAQHAPDSDALSELVNQWVGGLERLRWVNMEKPISVAITSHPIAPDFPHASSGATANSWASQWATLRALAAGNGPLSMETALRERGLGKVADLLASAVRQVDANTQELDIADNDDILAAAEELAALERLVERLVAPSLGVNMGFSDADGD